MSELGSLIEREMEEIRPAEFTLSEVARTRDRKRRRQRITAAAIGVAFAVIAVLVAMSVRPSATVPVKPTPTPSVTEPVQPSAVSNGDITFQRGRVIYMVHPDGSGLRKLLTLPPCALASECKIAASVRWADWSPDGSHLAMLVSGRSFPAQVYVVNAEGSDLHSLRATDKDGRVLPGCPCGEPAWSPDGSRIAVVAATEGSAVPVSSHHLSVDIFGMDGRLEHCLRAPVSSLHLSWSQDGTRIYFGGRLNDSTLALYVVREDGSGLHKLGTVPAEDLENWDGGTVEWLPNHSGVAYVVVRGGVSNAYVENPLGSPPRLITRTGCSPCSWSPDGSRLLYADHVGVWTVDAHGNDRGFITHSAVAVLWSPDGRWVVVRRGSNDAERVFVMRTDGSGSTQVASGPVEILAWQGLKR